MTKVTYCTDVEGHWPYFCNFVDLSEGLRFAVAGDHRNSPRPPPLVLEPGWHFVFGGDSCDKGPGTLRFLDAVVKLKMDNPNKVTLLLGNRDLNKMRWTSELDQAEIDRLTPSSPAAFWVGPKQRLKPWDYTKGEAARVEGVPLEQVTDDMVRRHNTKAVRLRYHLKHDMGSDGEFEFRRQELALMSEREPAAVSDDEVVESYEKSLGPGGLMRAYIELGQLALLLNDTLFVHGQLVGFNGDKWSLGRVPDPQQGPENDYSRAVNNVQEWVEQLNLWALMEVQRWVLEPRWATPPVEETFASWEGRAGSELMAYGTPATRNPSVVYCRWLDADSMPKALPQDMQDYLVAQGVNRVIVGHTPHGNCPTIIPNGTDAGPQVVVMMADTSFSHMKADQAFKGDNRGDAVAEVALHGSKCVVKGRTATQQIIDYEVPPSGDRRIGQTAWLASDADGSPVSVSPVAKDDSTPFFVKAKLAQLGEGGTKYLLCNVDGFKNTYQEASLDWVDTEFFAGTALPRDDPSRSVSVTSHGEEFGASCCANDGAILARIFKKLDRDGDGVITCRELLTACTDLHVRQALSYHYPNTSIEEVFDQLDKNKDGGISIEEFSLAMVKCMNTCGSRL